MTTRINKTERKVLLAIEAEGPAYAWQLRKRCQLSSEKVSAALKRLTDSGRLRRKKSGAWMIDRSKALRGLIKNGAANVFPAPWWNTEGGFYG